MFAPSLLAQEEDTAIHVQAMMSTPRFRCYRTTDVTGSDSTDCPVTRSPEADGTAASEGVELGGALKNVLAIACGISDGLEFGNNARAALITRGSASCRSMRDVAG